jgi:tetratricopeptide (TPR) repeat protein
VESQELLRKAQLLFVDGKNEESIEAYTKAIEAGAELYIAHLSRGVAYVKTNKIDLALDDFDRAVDANKQSFRAYFYRGMAHMMKEEFEKAAEDFTGALNIKTDYAMAKFSRAVSFARLGRYEEASKDMAVVMPMMEQNLQSFADSYGIVRTQMFKVMAQMSAGASVSPLTLGAKDMDTLKKWLDQE